MRKVFGLGVLKNEADIIESYIRYHLTIFDGIVLLDNGSTDRTIEIIQHLQNEGLPVYLKIDTNLSHVQGEKTTDLINYTFNKFNPDFIFPLDVDEFLYGANYSGNPRKLVNHLLPNKVYYLEREYTYFPIHVNESEVFIPRRIVYASPIKDYWPKVIVSRYIWETYSATISGGNHDLLFDKRNVKTEVLKNLKLAHFPYRSVEQLKSKIMVGWINTLATHDYMEGHNYHWRELFEKLKDNGTDITINEILENNERPVPMNLSFCHGLDIKYTTNNEVSAMKNLLNYCESLARRYGELDNRLRGES